MDRGDDASRSDCREGADGELRQMNETLDDGGERYGLGWTGTRR
jgi:hypothetical protein